MKNLENQWDIIIPKSLQDFVVSVVDGVQTSITRPSINVNNFELKSTMI